MIGHFFNHHGYIILSTTNCMKSLRSYQIAVFVRNVGSSNSNTIYYTQYVVSYPSKMYCYYYLLSSLVLLVVHHIILLHHHHNILMQTTT